MHTGGHYLMLVVLDQAIADLQSGSIGIRWRTRSWFLAAATDHVFAFARICREFGGDPAAVRARLFASVRARGRIGTRSNNPATLANPSAPRRFGAAAVLYAGSPTGAAMT